MELNNNKKKELTEKLEALSKYIPILHDGLTVRDQFLVILRNNCRNNSTASHAAINSIYLPKEDTTIYINRKIGNILDNALEKILANYPCQFGASKLTIKQNFELMFFNNCESWLHKINDFVEISDFCTKFITNSYERQINNNDLREYLFAWKFGQKLCEFIFQKIPEKNIKILSENTVIILKNILALNQSITTNNIEYLWLEENDSWRGFGNTLIKNIVMNKQIIPELFVELVTLLNLLNILNYAIITKSWRNDEDSKILAFLLQDAKNFAKANHIFKRLINAVRNKLNIYYREIGMDFLDICKRSKLVKVLKKQENNHYNIVKINKLSNSFSIITKKYPTLVGYPETTLSNTAQIYKNSFENYIGINFDEQNVFKQFQASFTLDIETTFEIISAIYDVFINLNQKFYDAPFNFKFLSQLYNIDLIALEKHFTDNDCHKVIKYMCDFSNVYDFKLLWGLEKNLTKKTKEDSVFIKKFVTTLWKTKILINAVLFHLPLICLFGLFKNQCNINFLGVRTPNNTFNYSNFLVCDLIMFFPLIKNNKNNELKNEYDKVKNELILDFLSEKRNNLGIETYAKNEENFLVLKNNNLKFLFKSAMTPIDSAFSFLKVNNDLICFQQDPNFIHFRSFFFEKSNFVNRKLLNFILNAQGPVNAIVNEENIETVAKSLVATFRNISENLQDISEYFLRDPEKSQKNYSQWNHFGGIISNINSRIKKIAETNDKETSKKPCNITNYTLISSNLLKTHPNP